MNKGIEPVKNLSTCLILSIVVATLNYKINLKKKKKRVAMVGQITREESI